MQEYFGIKELYDVTLKTTIPMRIGNRDFETGEPILYFDKVQISLIEEDTTRVIATGGKSNRNLILWEDTKEVSFTLQEGIMSKLGFAMLANANVVSRDAQKEYVIVPKRELLLTNSNGQVKLRFIPLMVEPFFVFDNESKVAEKINDFEVEDNILTLPNNPNSNIMVTYYFRYDNPFEIYQIGDKLFNGYLKLEGKIYFKDDQTGLNKTSLFEMPRTRLTSNLSIRVGERADPVVSTFTVIGFPGKLAESRLICKLTLLDDDIDYDI